VSSVTGAVAPVGLSPNAQLPMSTMLAKVRALDPGRPEEDERPPGAKKLVKLIRAPVEESGQDLRELLAPTLVMAVDSRVPGPSLRVLLKAAQDAGYRSVAFAGEDRLGQLMRQAGAPLLEAMWAPAYSPPALLAGAMPNELAERDPVLFHGRPGANDSLKLAPRFGSTEPARVLSRGADGRFVSPARQDFRDRPPRTEDPRPAYLEFDGTTSATALAELLSALWANELWPVLCPDAVPGSPGSAAKAAPEALREPEGELFGEEAPAGKAAGAGLDPEVIRQVVRRHMAQLKRCYEQALQRDPTLSGKLNVEFVISPTGSVSSARIGSATAASGGLETCVTSQVRSWAFPRPRNGQEVEVAYPFVFNLAGP